MLFSANEFLIGVAQQILSQLLLVHDDDDIVESAGNRLIMMIIVSSLSPFTIHFKSWCAFTWI